MHDFQEGFSQCFSIVFLTEFICATHTPYDTLHLRLIWDYIFPEDLPQPQVAHGTKAKSKAISTTVTKEHLINILKIIIKKTIRNYFKAGR